MSDWDNSRKSGLDSVKMAIGKMLIDFKNWCFADTKAFNHWKQLSPRDAIKVGPSRMIDDVDSLLSKYRQQQTDKGYVAPLPVMLVSIATMVSPPEVSAIRGLPYWLEAKIPNDPEQRPIKIRTIPRQYRVQLAFVAAEGDTAQGVINQFCAYMQDDFKRRIKATYDLGAGIKDEWHLTVLENSLYPDSVPSGQNNMAINTVDFQVIGLLPQVVGLTEYDKTGTGGTGVDLSGRDVLEDGREWAAVIEADLRTEENPSDVLRASADPATGERRVDKVSLGGDGE